MADSGSQKYYEELAKKWREFAAKHDWSEISQQSIGWMPMEERLELKKILEEYLPSRKYGEGLDVYDSPILPDEAEGNQFWAARLYSDLQSFVDEPPTTLSESLEHARRLAIEMLRRDGVRYEGLQDTYLFYRKGRGSALGGDWVQLKSDFGAAIYKRSIQYLLEDSSEAPPARSKRWHEWVCLYPWRNCKNIGTIFSEHRVEPWSYSWLALKALEIIDFVTAENPHRGHRSRDAELFELGTVAERLHAVQFDFDALRGQKIQKSAILGGLRASELTKELWGNNRQMVCQKMKEYIDKGHTVKRAAEFTHKAGCGVSAEANRRMWYRCTKL